MIRAVISTGSNMGDSRAHLATVPEFFHNDPASRVLKTSRVYSTPPWGKTDQEPFFNQVLIIKTERTPAELLAVCQQLEQDAQRVRTEKWGPRTLDVDLIEVLGQRHEVISTSPELTLPHPHAHERAFVLVPWLEVEEHATLGGKPVSSHLAQLDPEDVRAVVAVEG